MWLGLLCKPKVEMFLGCSVCIEGLRGLVWVEALGCLVCDDLVLWSLVCVEILKNLRRHVTPQRDICLISDRHESTKSAYNDPQKGWHDTPTTHVYCIRHIAQNFRRAIRDGELRKQVVNMGNNHTLIIMNYTFFYNLSNYYYYYFAM